MAKTIRKVSMRKLSTKDVIKAIELGLTQYDFRWYKAIHTTGEEGAYWGGLPLSISHRLFEKGLIHRIGVTVWAKDFGPERTA